MILNNFWMYLLVMRVELPVKKLPRQLQNCLYFFLVKSSCNGAFKYSIPGL